MTSSASAAAATAAEDAPPPPSPPPSRPFRVRAVTAFAILRAEDFDEDSSGEALALGSKIDACGSLLRDVESRLVARGFEVQTLRIATNPFEEWLTAPVGGDGGGNGGAGGGDGPPGRPEKRARTTTVRTTADDDEERARASSRLPILDSHLARIGVDFCSLGPSSDPGRTASICPLIVAASGRFACSADVGAGDVAAARAAAACVAEVSRMGGEGAGGAAYPPHLAGGLGNFRFCASSRVRSVPFFPAARSPESLEEGLAVGVGLENGAFARSLLEEATSVANVRRVFHTRMREELMAVQDACLEVAGDASSRRPPARYLGVDTSLNPSLDEGGSVAAAIESLAEVRGRFGTAAGTLAAAAAVTTALQSIPDVRTTGYCGLMLPVLEDRRLAALAARTTDDRAPDRLTIRDLLAISSVCGVGVDTVPIPGDVDVGDLASLILDVAALAGRWDKPLSCRVFPVPGKKAGSRTAFGSPYMCDSDVFDL